MIRELQSALLGLQDSHAFPHNAKILCSIRVAQRIIRKILLMEEKQRSVESFTSRMMVSTWHYLLYTPETNLQREGAGTRNSRCAMASKWNHKAQTPFDKEVLPHIAAMSLAGIVLDWSYSLLAMPIGKVSAVEFDVLQTYCHYKQGQHPTLLYEQLIEEPSLSSNLHLGHA